MSLRARTRGPHERNRVEYRAHTDTGGTWQPGTITYEGEHLTVVALDNGATVHVFDGASELRDRGAGRDGDAILDIAEDGINQTGRLGTCWKCNGHGTLFVPDPVQPEITEQAPGVQALTTEAYRLLELIELARERGGLYLVSNTGERQLTAYARTSHGSWFAADVAQPRPGTPGAHQFNITSMGSLEASGLITVTTVTQEDELPGQLLKALHANGQGRISSDWDDDGITLYRPAPTSDPYGKPERAAMEEVLRVALDWLYKTEQPHGAGITQHGIGSADLPTIPNRRISLLPSWSGNGPIVSVKVAAPVKASTYLVRNPLAPGELDEWAEVIEDLGYGVVQDWPTEAGVSGSIRLVEQEHPSLTAAYQLYLTGCLTHSRENPVADGETGGGGTGGSLCRCGWWREPARLLVTPTWPTPATP